MESALEKISKEGEEKQKKITKVARIKCKEKQYLK